MGEPQVHCYRMLGSSGIGVLPVAFHEPAMFPSFNLPPIPDR